ncbi:hypothetical protein JCM10908_002690 [Rhodotorula pacifica]|uniref:Pin4p n=1 Tax=Rhodotorula pacifica TaxID=1495444 RepID=UPI003172EA97
MSGVQGLGIPAFGGAAGGSSTAPAGAAGGGGSGIRKQRSQRFTVPYSHARSQSSSSSSTPSPAPPPPVPPVPSLPYLAPSLPVQSQSQPHHSPVDPTSAMSLEFLASPTGMSPYPGPAFTSQAQAQAQAAVTAASGAGGGGVSPGTAGSADEIIETAIVIKSIPFACPKEHLLAVMASLSLPPPFAFNYHYAPEDPTSFRGLAFANYRLPSEAALVRAAMDGLEIMGRKLRAEFKKQLRPGEKEMIERTKAIKRMRSAQMLASTGAGSRTEGGGGPPVQGWQRREASAPGGWPSSSASSFGMSNQGDTSTTATTFGQREFVPAPPVPAIPAAFMQQQQQQQQQYGLGSGGVGVVYQQPQPQHYHARQQSLSNLAATDAPNTSTDEGTGGGTGGDGSKSSVVSVSDVGTSVSQRAARVSASEGEEEEAGGGSGGSRGVEEEGSEIGESEEGGEGDYHLDMNDPSTLELYSRVLLFSSDPLRDELSFSRSLSPAQRRAVHLIARKLGLEHRSLGEGERRCVVVYKRGCAPPSHVEGGGGAVGVAGEKGRNEMGRFARMDPPRRSLRGSVSSIVLRQAASSPTDYLHPTSSSSIIPSHDFSSSPSRLAGPPRHQHSSSSSGSGSAGSSSMLPSPIGTGSNGLYAQQQQQQQMLRGKKSMPDMRYTSHASLMPAAGGVGAASMAMLPSFSGSGSSGLSVQPHQHQQQYLPHSHQQQHPHSTGSRSSSPYDAYSTPASSPMGLLPVPSSGYQQNHLTSSVSLGADLAGYLGGAKSSYPYQDYQQHQQPTMRLPDVAEAAFNAAPMYPNANGQQAYSPQYEAVDAPISTSNSYSAADMMHGIRKSFSTMRLGGGGNSSGWNDAPSSSTTFSSSSQAHNDYEREQWPLDGTKTMGPRQFRRHVALPTEWTQQRQQQQQQSVQNLFSAAAEPNSLAPQQLRSTASVGAGLGGGGAPGGLEWRRRGGGE